MFAHNAVGDGPPSVASPAVVPHTAPGAPTAVVASPLNASASVSWTAPASDGGVAITGYTVTSSPGSKTCTTAGALTCTVSGLTNGTSYTFTVVASNGAPGAPSAPSNAVVPLTIPGAPTSVVAVAGDTSASVSWTAPASNGGSAITSYTVTSTPGNKTCTWITGPLTCTVSTLTNGTSYTFTVFAHNAAGDGPPSTASNAVVPSLPIMYTAVTPTRVLDSRPATKVGAFASPWTAGTQRDVTIGDATLVPVGAVAVVLNVTVTDTTAPSFLTLWPTGQARPTASSLNWTAGQTIPNAVTVKLGTSRQVSVYNLTGSADVIIDVAGFYMPGTGVGFTSTVPTRVLDSRPATNVGAFASPWTAGTQRDVTIGDATLVPVGAVAVVLNVTVTDTTAPSFLTLWPTGQARPTASSLNWTAGLTIPNAVTVKLGTSRQVSVYNLTGSADVIIDVAGYYMAGGLPFHPVDPTRVLDSRPGSQVGIYNTPWGTGTTRAVTVGAATLVPVSADSVVLNTTVTNTGGQSFLTVWPTGVARPTASNLNWTAGVTIPNAVTVKLGTVATGVGVQPVQHRGRHHRRGRLVRLTARPAG